MDDRDIKLPKAPVAEEPEEKLPRRRFVKEVAFAAAGMAALGASGVLAEEKTAHIPPTESVAKIFGPDAYKALTPPAQKLTKAELLSIQAWWRTRKGDPPLHMSMKDLHSIEEAWEIQKTKYHGIQAEGDACCCCSCCPCCSCTAAAQTRVFLKETA